MTGKPVDYAAFDEVVVDRLVAGRHAGEPIRPADAAEAILRLNRDGYSDGQIAYRIGYASRSVIRIRARRGIPAALSPGTSIYHRKHDTPTRRPKRKR